MSNYYHRSCERRTTYQDLDQHRRQNQYYQNVCNYPGNPNLYHQPQYPSYNFPVYQPQYQRMIILEDNSILHKQPKHISYVQKPTPSVQPRPNSRKSRFASQSSKQIPEQKCSAQASTNPGNGPKPQSKRAYRSNIKPDSRNCAAKPTEVKKKTITVIDPKNIVNREEMSINIEKYNKEKEKKEKKKIQIVSREICIEVIYYFRKCRTILKRRMSLNKRNINNFRKQTMKLNKSIKASESNSKDSQDECSTRNPSKESSSTTQSENINNIKNSSYSASNSSQHCPLNMLSPQYNTFMSTSEVSSTNTQIKPPAKNATEYRPNQPIKIQPNINFTTSQSKKESDPQTSTSLSNFQPVQPEIIPSNPPSNIPSSSKPDTCTKITKNSRLSSQPPAKANNSTNSQINCDKANVKNSSEDCVSPKNIKNASPINLTKVDICNQQLSSTKRSNSIVVPRNPPPGLPNIGNTCFMNSVTQCLLATPLIESSLSSKLNLSSPSEGNLAKYFKELIEHRKAGEVPRSIVKNLKENVALHNNRFKKYNQEDAAEFLSTLICGIGQDLEFKRENVKIEEENIVEKIEKEEGETEKVKLLKQCIKEMVQINKIGNSEFMNYFRAQIYSEIQCDECKYMETCFEDRIMMELDLPKEKYDLTLKQCFDKTFELCHYGKENENNCTGCGNITCFTRKEWISKLPKIMIVHLKRFETNDYGEQVKK